MSNNTNYLARTGVFRGKAVSWGAKTISEDRTLLVVWFDVHSIFKFGEWESLVPARVKGEFFLTKKTGAPDEKVFAMLCERLGWTGTFSELEEGPPLDVEQMLGVESSESKGKTYYSAKWIDSIDADPEAERGFGKVDLKALDAAHGNTFAEIAKKFGKPAKAQADRKQRIEETPVEDIPF